MLTMHFVSQYGVPFSATEDELSTGTSHPMTGLEYIKYCLDRGAVLKRVESN